MGESYKLKVKPLHQIVLDDFCPMNGGGIVNLWIPEYSNIYLMTAIIKGASGKEHPLLVDLGCGGGLCSRLFSDMGAEVLAIDSKKELIVQAARAYGRDGLCFVEGSAENLRKIVELRKIGKVDAVYCSFMPEGENWAPFIEELQPDVILHVFEKYGERWASGTKESYKPSKDYEIYSVIPLISYRDLGNLDSLSLETAGTWLLIHVSKNSLERLIKTYGPIRELIAKSVTTNKYKWESELDIIIERVKSKGH